MKASWKKNVILFITGQSVSLFGSALVQYAITWYITLSTKSGTMMMISIICGFLPTLLVSPFAGVWADRFNRKRMIIAADSMIALSTLAVAVVFSAGSDHLWPLYVVSAIRALGQGIQSPAVMAVIPQLVPEDKLTRVNGINQSIQSLLQIFAPILSAVLLSISTIRTIFFIDVFTAALAVGIMLLFIQIQDHKNMDTGQKIAYFKDLKEGIHYIRKHIFVSRLMKMLTYYYILITPVAFLSPLQVAISFGDQVWRQSAIEITFSAGMIIGGLVIASWGGFKNRAYTIALAGAWIGVGTLALGLIPVFWIYLAVMILIGAGIPFWNTPTIVMLQEKVDKEYMGRVFSIISMIQSVMMPLGMTIFGPMADVIKLEWILAATGILIILPSFYIINSKVILEAGKQKAKEEAEPGSEEQTKDNLSE
jgi:DHA3 family macrolide efflux protein-like MFS transporter